MRTLTLFSLLVVTASSLGCAPKPIGTAPASGGAGTGGSSVAGAGGAVQNSVADAPTLPCQKQARDVAGNKGTSWYVRCPEACGAAGGSVWGTDLYTDDSSVCGAAIHAGHLAAGGGLILVTWIDSPRLHVGSAQNGITSTSYGKWSRDFFVQSVDAEGKPTSAPPAIDPSVLRLGCANNALEVSADVSGPQRVRCPGACEPHSVWGSGPYTGDSSVCLAAKHAGVIGDAGGELTVTMGGHVDALVGSTRNGVTTESYGAYDRTFTVSR